VTQPAIKRRVLWLWAAAVLATASAFVAHLSLRLETVRLGYDVGQARREERRLIEERRLLSIEAATLRDPERVETVARGSLGMEVPDADHVVPVGHGASRRASGRMR
jgi:cell division protein FtsL